MLQEQELYNMKKKKKNLKPETPEINIRNIKEAVMHIYKPAPSAATSDDVVMTIDIFYAISPICNFTKDALFIALKELGFKSTTIEGVLYWFVNTKIDA